MLQATYFWRLSRRKGDRSLQIVAQENFESEWINTAGAMSILVNIPVLYNKKTTCRFDLIWKIKMQNCKYIQIPFYLTKNQIWFMYVCIDFCSVCDIKFFSGYFFQNLYFPGRKTVTFFTEIKNLILQFYENQNFVTVVCSWKKIEKYDIDSKGIFEKNSIL